MLTSKARDAASQWHGALASLRRRNNSLGASIAAVQRALDHANIQEAQRLQVRVVRRGRHVERLIRFMGELSALVVA